MTTIVLICDSAPPDPPSYRAIAGAIEVRAASAGQALDAVTAQLGGVEGTTLVVLQPMRPDPCYAVESRQRRG